jgi:hypothetical protein
MQRILICVATLFTMAGDSGLAQEADEETLVAGLHPEIYGQIERTYAAFLEAPRYDLKARCEALAEIDRLKDITKDKGEIVKQLAIFAAITESEEDIHLFAAGTILGQLELSPSIPIRVFAPYLEAENKNLRGVTRSWFHQHDSHERTHGRPPLGSVNYHEYMEYVGARLARNEEIPDPFINYIYERHPGKALLVFAYAHRRAVGAGQLLILRKAFEARQQGRELGQDELLQLRREKQQQELRQQKAWKQQSEILLAEHIVSNAIWQKENEFGERLHAALPEANAELAKLAKHKVWWARLYVAHIMRQHLVLRQEDILEQLKADSNPLVSKAAKFEKQ